MFFHDFAKFDALKKAEILLKNREKIDAQRGRRKNRENIGLGGCLISILAGYGAAFGCFGALLGASWVFLGASWARLGRIFGALGGFWAYLGRLLGLSGASWSHLGSIWVRFGRVWGWFGEGFGRVLASTWIECRRSLKNSRTAAT